MPTGSFAVGRFVVLDALDTNAAGDDWHDAALALGPADGVLLASLDTVVEEHITGPDYRPSIVTGSGAAIAGYEWRWSEVWDPSDWYDWVWADRPVPTLTWGLQAIRAPYVWNLTRYIQERKNDLPVVAVLDSGFFLHPDVPTVLSSDGLGMVKPSSHGTAVASILGAAHNEAGISGVLPLAEGVPMAAEITGTFVDNMNTVFRYYNEALQGKNVIVSMSAGMNYLGFRNDQQGNRVFYQADPDCPYKHYVCSESERDRPNSWNNLAATQGRTVKSVLDEMRRHDPDLSLLWFCSAGNSNMPPSRTQRFRQRGREVVERHMTARQSSGCAWAGSMGDPNIVVVENLHFAMRLAPSSHTLGTLSAPGFRIGQNSHDKRQPTTSYGTGTSQATPLAAGAAALLWSLDPTMTATSVRYLLKSTAVPIRTHEGYTGANALDLWAALQAMPNLPKLPVWIADVDDGTLDGNSYDNPGRSPTERGNGCVDLSDYRAFRDAYHLRDAFLPDLSGRKRSLNQDQNGDGIVDPSDERWFSEHRFSRFDFNADGTLQGDLAELGAQWGRCASTSGATPNTPYAFDWRNPDSLDTIDIWLAIEGADAIQASVGEWSLVLTREQVARNSSNGFLLLTLPTQACANGETLVLTGGVEPREFECPVVPYVANDYVLPLKNDDSQQPSAVGWSMRCNSQSPIFVGREGSKHFQFAANVRQLSDTEFALPNARLSGAIDAATRNGVELRLVEIRQNMQDYGTLHRIIAPDSPDQTACHYVIALPAGFSRLNIPFHSAVISECPGASIVGKRGFGMTCTMEGPD